jgi:eukaryotic-like serine/threonine-protein kinase
MSFDPQRLKQLFLDAAAITDRAQRQAWLVQQCGQDADLLAKVQALLKARENPESFLDILAPAAPAQSPVTEMAQDAAGQPSSFESPGTLIGPYKLIEQIGEGGMGTVWMAQQTQPVKRLVAVKLIKAGMDSKQFIARFEAERQALALMDHPHIARVLDAGTTSAGRPYFVMDLVKGVPITKYCDEHHLTPRQRLELFIPVCQAIQHAHQKGIIHRDLKPSNVAVALYDGKPVPKVIDFGVAKAAGHTLTDKTLVTGFGSIVGTLEYMSPEQAEINQLDIDTRSDIYSLGVLLYELLAGSPPFTKKDLEKAGMLEMLRVIREQEPSKPSTKLSSSDALPTLSANRGTEPAKLTKLVRGELDWIVMKALEKDRNRRYDTANGLAMDLQRYLNDEPVQACPPSTWYRFGKSARKYKKMLATVAVFAVLLVAATVISIGLASWALRERNRAEEQKGEAEANFQSALQAVDQMLTRVGETELLNVPQMEPVRRNLLQDALRFYQEFLRKRSDSPRVRSEAASAYLRLGQIQILLGQRNDGEEAYRQAVALLEQLLAESPGDPDFRHKLAGVHTDRGALYLSTQRWAQSEAEFQKAVGLREQLQREQPALARNRLHLAKNHANLGLLYRRMGKFDQAEAAFRQALTLVDSLLAGDAKNEEYLTLKATAYQNGAMVYRGQGRSAAAKEACRQAIALNEELIRDHPKVVAHQKRLAGTYNNLGLLYAGDDEGAKAEDAYRQSLALHEALLRDHPHVVSFMLDVAGSCENLAAHIRKSRSPEESLAWSARAIHTTETVLAQDPRDADACFGLFNASLGRARALFDLGRREEANRDWRRAIELSEGKPLINMRLYRPNPLARLGEHLQAAKEMETLLAEGHTQALNIHTFSWVYAICSAAAANDARLPAAEREKLADQYGRRAVELLRRAQAAGYYRDAGRLAQMKQNKDLDTIRNRDDFKRLMAELEAVQKGSVTNQGTEKKQ